MTPDISFLVHVFTYATCHANGLIDFLLSLRQSQQTLKPKKKTLNAFKKMRVKLRNTLFWIQLGGPNYTPAPCSPDFPKTNRGYAFFINPRHCLA